MNTDFQKEFDANLTNLHEFKSNSFPFAPIREIRVASLSVSIRVHLWFSFFISTPIAVFWVLTGC